MAAAGFFRMVLNVVARILVEGRFMGQSFAIPVVDAGAQKREPEWYVSSVVSPAKASRSHWGL